MSPAAACELGSLLLLLMVMSNSSSSSSSSSLREFVLCQIHDVLRQAHVRGYTLDPSSRSTLSRAEPGRTRQVRAKPGMALDRVFFNRNLCPEMKLFWRL